MYVEIAEMILFSVHVRILRSAVNQKVSQQGQTDDKDLKSTILQICAQI